MSTKTEGLINVGATRLHVRLSSTGPEETLILIAGGPGSSHHYMTPLERLSSPQLRVVSYDARGTGKSVAPPSLSVAPTAHLDDLEALRRGLCGEHRVHLLGHSWGGAVALLYAAQFEARLASLTLVAPVFPSGQGLVRANTLSAIRIDELLRTGQLALPPTDDPEAIARALAPALFANPQAPLPPELDASTMNQRVLAAVTREMRTSTPPVGLDRLTVPTLVVSGDLDAIGLDALGEVTRRLSSAPLTRVVIERCGHYPWFEQPDAFYPPIEAFLARVTGSVSSVA